MNITKFIIIRMLFISSTVVAEPNIQETFFEKISHISSPSSNSSLGRIKIKGLITDYEKQYKISHDSKWRKLSGWKGFHPLRPTTWDYEPRNHHRLAYADSTGMNSPADDFISFATEYFYPSHQHMYYSIKCRTPRKFNYINQHFSGRGHPIWKKTQCRSISAGFLDDLIFIDPISQKVIDMGPINENTVSDFELLYATPGTDDIAEVAGHLLLRIRLKNQIKDGPHSYNTNDLVVSFLANTEQAKSSNASCHESKPIDNFDPTRETLQALKGLTGGLNTIFHRATLEQTVRSYTLFQDRNLLRYKLNLSTIQKRKLLEYLYEVKRSYTSRYFFFDLNCASILTQVIGDALDWKEFAEPSSPVLPPHSLVSQLIRKGVAEQVYPSFYSYRRVGHGAQKEMTRIYQNYKESKKVSLRRLLNSNDKSRSLAFKELGSRVLENKNPTLISVLKLGQFAELSYLDIKDPCKSISSDSVAQIRRYSRLMIASHKSEWLAVAENGDRINHSLHSIDQDNARGSNHTRLSTPAIGLKYRNGQEYSYLNLNLFKQDMGSMSRYAMQRTAYVRFAQVSLDFDINNNEINRSNISLLKLKKFKEKLNKIPSIWKDYSRYGLVLSLLDLTKMKNYHRIEYGSLGGIICLWSSEQFDNHLSFYGALSAVELQKNDHIQKALGLPLGIKGLWTIDRSRNWQVRGEVSRWSEISGTKKYYEVEANLSLERRVTWSDTEGIVSLGSQYRESTLFEDSTEWKVGYEHLLF